MNRPPVTKWPESAIARFVRDWNEGVSSEALRERFGGSPSQVAQVLRRLGHVLDARHGRERVNGFPKNRPVDVRAKWAT